MDHRSFRRAGSAGICAHGLRHAGKRHVCARGRRGGVRRHDHGPEHVRRVPEFPCARKNEKLRRHGISAVADGRHALPHHRRRSRYRRPDGFGHSGNSCGNDQSAGRGNRCFCGRYRAGILPVQARRGWGMDRLCRWRHCVRKLRHLLQGGGRRRKRIRGRRIHGRQHRHHASGDAGCFRGHNLPDTKQCHPDSGLQRGFRYEGIQPRRRDLADVCGCRHGYGQRHGIFPRSGCRRKSFRYVLSCCEYRQDRAGTAVRLCGYGRTGVRKGACFRRFQRGFRYEGIQPRRRKLAALHRPCRIYKQRHGLLPRDG